MVCTERDLSATAVSLGWVLVSLWQFPVGAALQKAEPWISI